MGKALIAPRKVAAYEIHLNKADDAHSDNVGSEPSADIFAFGELVEATSLSSTGVCIHCMLHLVNCKLRRTYYGGVPRNKAAFSVKAASCHSRNTI